jgi:tetratricopeptide (TPR) repeat protein
MNKEQIKHDPVAEAIVSGISKYKPYWKQILIGVIIIALAVIAVSNTYSSKKNYPVEAGEALASITSPAALIEVVKQYPKSFAASAALMQLGAYEAQRTNYASAKAYFQKIVNEYQDSFLVPAAYYAIAKCYVGEQNYKEAEDVLKRNLLYDRDHYAAFAAQAELVNVLTAMGRYSEALNEIAQVEQVFGSETAQAIFGGLNTRLMRLSGLSTNFQQQVSQNATLQQ